jgi:hypothetical protein
MALHVQSSFAAGELDPALHERTTFDKYQSGLATARNGLIGKTGRYVSRPGRILYKKTKNSNEKVRIYNPPNTNCLIELGPLYIRMHYISTPSATPFEFAHSFTEDDLPNIEFLTNKYRTYVFCEGKVPKVYFIDINNDLVQEDTTPFFTPTIPTSVSITPNGPPTGYAVQYVATLIKDGQESLVSTSVLAGSIPIVTNHSNTIKFRGLVADAPTELNVYRRPTNGGVFGFIGSTTFFADAGPNRDFTFEDLGGGADYTHNPPEYIKITLVGRDQLAFTDPLQYKSKTAAIYQQRLLLSNNDDLEAIIASRTGYANNFTRDFPLGSDSALQFKAGANGFAKVLRLLENDGLVVFTEIGIFLHTGALTTTNLSLTQKGNWIIDDNVAPIGVPGGAIFIDYRTNTVRQLGWSEEAQSYTGKELSAYSNHLFTGKRAVSWCFEEGDTPVLWIALDDGTYVSFTWEPEQQMNAWTRHDTEAGLVEHVCSGGIANKTVFLVNQDGERYIEMTVPRYVSGVTLETDPEAYMGHSIAAMDSMLSYRTKLNDSLLTDDFFTIAPVVSGEWDGPLRITTNASNIFDSPGIGDVGKIYRFFDDDKTSIDLEVTINVGPRDITVQPSSEFPSSHALDARLYNTGTTFTGLTHLEGEYPSVMVDGYVVSSPNNDVENYPALQVVGGELTLPSDMRGAIVHIGQPITYDFQPLDIDTVEQRPTLVESLTVNKVLMKVYKSRGLYLGIKFPANNKVTGMFEIDQKKSDYEAENEVIGNRFEQPSTQRIEMTLPGDWKSQGKFALRQVDPLHFEILSIIPDLDDMRR